MRVELTLTRLKGESLNRSASSPYGTSARIRTENQGLEHLFTSPEPEAYGGLSEI